MDIETDNQEKPIEIIELEKATGIIFKYSERNLNEIIEPNCYSLNSKRKVNGISIVDKHLFDI